MVTRRALVLVGCLALAPSNSAAAAGAPVFKFYWGEGCRHCEAAKLFVRKLKQEHPKLRFESWEVRKDPTGRKHFVNDVKRLKIQKPSVPTFVCGDGYVSGYKKETTEPCVRELLRRCTR